MPKRQQATGSNSTTKRIKTISSYVRYFEPSSLVLGRYMLNCMDLQFHAHTILPHTTTTDECRCCHCHNDQLQSNHDHKKKAVPHLPPPPPPPFLKILEVGSGTGGLAKELTQLPGVAFDELRVTDISDEMLNRSKRRLVDEIEYYQRQQQEDNDGNDDNQQQYLSHKCRRRVIVEEANSEQLWYEDEAFHRYYSNMVLHYVEHTNCMIRESYRVLQPGGIAGMTIWGRSEDSPLMTIVPDVLRDLKLRPPSDGGVRTNFHLGEDDDALRKLFFDVGYERCTVIHVPSPIECLDATTFVNIIIDGVASTKREVDMLSLSDQQKVREEVYRRGKAVLDSGRPMSLDCAVIIAKKGDGTCPKCGGSSR